MITVVLGSNHLVDCDNIIAIRQHPLLRAITQPLRLSLTTPPDLPSSRMVQVVENEVQEGTDAKVRVIKSETSVAIFWWETPLAIATVLDETTVSLRLDLRPLGINLYDDAAGLHVGGNQFAGNEVVKFQTAIGLG